MRMRIMKALPVLLALFCLGACASAPVKVSLPEQVEGGFTRTQNLGLRAVYAGPGTVTVTLTEMRSSGDAFEALQHWKPEPGRMAFFKDKFFAVAESKDLDQKAMNAFVSAIQKAM